MLQKIKEWYKNRKVKKHLKDLEEENQICRIVGDNRRKYIK